MTLNLLCLYCYIIFSATGCQVNSDPAPGRSPGPPPIESVGNAYTSIDSNQTMHDNGTFDLSDNVNSSELSNKQQQQTTEEKIIKSSNKLKTFINQINTSKFNNQKKNLESLRSESDRNKHCKRVDAYVGGGGDEEKIVHVERGNDDTVPIKFDVIHDLFDTQRGLINGLIYTGEWEAIVLFQPQS